MRVVAGTAKSIRLKCPRGVNIRPTRDAVRESLFNMLASRLPDARFLDLFAGTGANGIEALSRGVRSCTFVESSPIMLKTIRGNLEATGLTAQAELRRLVLPKGLQVLASDGLTYDLIFADPPYEDADHNTLLAQIRCHQLLVPSGILVLEHAARTPLPEQLGGYRRSRQARYGATTLSFFVDALYGM